MSEIEESVVKELKSKHGGILSAVTARDGTTMVFRPPLRQEFDRWFESRDKDNNRVPAARELALSCLVFPEREIMLSAIERQPALLVGTNGISDAILDMAGLADGASSVKKL